jgi:SAM-dependent methyltransferase
VTSSSARIPFKKCPLCAATDFPEFKVAPCSTHPLYQAPLPDTIHWHRCKHCNHVFTSGYFSEDAVKVLLSKTPPNQKLGFDIEEMRSVASRIVERVADFGPSEGAWLDVGFGNGALLFTALEWGYEPVGIDLRKDSVADISRLGIEAHCMDIAALNHPGRYAVISMADVLEHMPFPADALIAAQRLLTKNGVLFVSTPNSESIAWLALTEQDANPYWSEIEHYHNFSRARLSALLDEHGFRVIHFTISQRYRLGMEIIAARRS